MQQEKTFSNIYDAHYPIVAPKLLQYIAGVSHALQAGELTDGIILI